MSQYCPLCEQEVSKALYEKITGIWKEKEKHLAVLKKKEKQLEQREKKLLKQHKDEKKEILAKEREKSEKELQKQKIIAERAIKREKQSIKNEIKLIEKKYDKKLLSSIDRIKKEEKANQRKITQGLKTQIELSARKSIDKERKKLAKEIGQMEKRERIINDRNGKLNKQFISLQSKSKKELEASEKQCKRLQEQLEKNQTPQMLGLLEEKTFLGKLKKEFPGDKFEHTGKGGDIVHSVMDRGNNIGIIVYELKRVAKFNNKHITQTLLAKQQRNADYGLLVTNAKRPKDDFGFLVEKKVIIIHPAGTLALVSILRDQLISLSKLKLSVGKRKQAIEGVLEYIQSPKFKNSIQSIIMDTEELYSHLEKEVKVHLKEWEFRLSKY